MSGILDRMITRLNDAFYVQDHTDKHLHVGEVMNLWSYLKMCQNSISSLEIFMNTTLDADLRTLLKEYHDVFKVHEKQLRDFLINEGITIPMHADPKPVSNPDAVPLGTKLTEFELSYILTLRLKACIMSCTAGLMDSFHPEVTVLFTEFLSELYNAVADSKVLFLKRGWLEPPPTYFAPGAPGSDHIVQ